MTAGAGAAARARSMDIPSVQIDGNDVLAVHGAAGTLVREVRAGGGPRLLHALTYRIKGHVSVDPAAYRDADEVNAALQTDPIARARRHWLDVPGIGARVLDAIEREAAEEVAAAVAAAEAAPWPEAGAAYTDVQTTGAGQWR
jgi:pyruvate dehydrogenase E1 component alpha subunit